jgi:hypothetical protein
MGWRVFWIQVERIDRLKAIRFPGACPSAGKHTMLAMKPIGLIAFYMNMTPGLAKAADNGPQATFGF